METSTKLALHVSPPSISVNPMHRRNYDEIRRNNNEEMWQLRRNFVAIGTKSYAKPITYDADVECATKNRRNLRRKSVVISTSAISQNQIYDAHVVYATKFVANCDEVSSL
jgi:hypothetical protein